MASANKFNQFTEDLAKGVHNLSANTLQIMLVNSPAPVATNTVKTNLTDITAQNGYPAGGNTPTITSCVQTSGLLKLILADTVFTASGGSFGPFRYVVLWNDSPSSPLDPLICWWDYGESISIDNGNTFTVDFDQTNGVLSIQ